MSRFERFRTSSPEREEKNIQRDVLMSDDSPMRTLIESTNLAVITKDPSIESMVDNRFSAMREVLGVIEKHENEKGGTQGQYLTELMQQAQKQNKSQEYIDLLTEICESQDIKDIEASLCHGGPEGQDIKNKYLAYSNALAAVKKAREPKPSSPNLVSLVDVGSLIDGDAGAAVGDRYLQACRDNIVTHYSNLYDKALGEKARKKITNDLYRGLRRTGVKDTELFLLLNDTYQNFIEGQSVEKRQKKDKERLDEIEDLLKNDPQNRDELLSEKEEIEEGWYEAALKRLSDLRFTYETKEQGILENKASAYYRIKNVARRIASFKPRSEDVKRESEKLDEDLDKAEKEIKTWSVKLAGTRAEVEGKGKTDQEKSDIAFEKLRTMLDYDVRKAVNGKIKEQLQKRWKFTRAVGNFLSSGDSKTKKWVKGMGTGFAVGSVVSAMKVMGVAGWPLTAAVGAVATPIGMFMHRAVRLSVAEKNLKAHEDDQGGAKSLFESDQDFQAQKDKIVQSAGSSDNPIESMAHYIMDTSRKQSESDNSNVAKETHRFMMSYGAGAVLGRIATAWAVPMIKNGVSNLFDSAEHTPNIPSAAPSFDGAADANGAGIGGALGASEHTPNIPSAAPSFDGAADANGAGIGGALGASEHTPGVPDALNVPKPDFSEYDYPWNWAADNFGTENAASKLHELADMAAQNGYDVEWHGSGANEWVSINGDSNTTSVLKVLSQYAKK